MKGFIESRKGLLFSALFFTGVCLLYVITALRRGLYEVLQFPSPMANIILFSGFLTLAMICWYRYLRYRPDREEFRHKKNAPLWAGMAVLCLLLASIFVFGTKCRRFGTLYSGVDFGCRLGGPGVEVEKKVTGCMWPVPFFMGCWAAERKNIFC